ncbi:MAG: carbohydrate ABC transporter permease [Firmicutes bacterium]|nr:carbohydrate ABC transporter permease [Bacillota bacterium]
MNPQANARVIPALTFLLLVLIAVLVLFPIYMSVLNSLKTEADMLSAPLSVPDQLQFNNYVEAFRKTNFLRSLGNTVVVAITGISGIIVFASMAGYKLSRTPGTLSKFLFGLFVMSMLIPFHSIMIGLTKITKQLRVQGSTMGLGLVYIGLGVPMAVFLYHGFVKSIPRELDEAALIDGCSELQLFFLVIFPQLRPITATITIINALWIWNDFLLPLLMLTDPDHYTLLLSTNMLVGEYSNDWPAILATLVMAVLPVILFYLLLQKYIMSGISEGAIKG